MSDFPTLPKTPIQEAILEFRFSMESELTEQAVSKLAERLKHNGWQTERRQIQETKIHLPGSGEALEIQNDTPSFDAFIVRDGPPTRVYQIRTSSFSVSHLQPYNGWESFERDAEVAFNNYVEMFNPQSVSRISARFINVIDVPERFELNDWFLCAPQVPETTNLNLSNFSQEIRAVDVDRNLRANIRMSNRLHGAGKHQVILDIDSYATGAFSTDFARLTQTLQSVRDLKNQCFFGYLTPHALAGYQ